MMRRDELINQKLLLLTEGELDLFEAKTAASIIRYRPGDVVAVIDASAAEAGLTVRGALMLDCDAPVLASVAEALKLTPRATALAIGIAPTGGRMPPAMRRHVADALAAGLDLISGLHSPLADDAEFAALAADGGGRIFDVRQVSEALPIATGRALNWPVRPVLALASDCNVGKMVTAIELDAEMNRRGRRSAFVPTGQTGIMLAGWGLAIDRTISDFTAGASEWLIGQVKDFEFAFVEGQGSLDHIGYGGVTLAQLYGTMPDWLIVCHRPGRKLHMSSPVPLKPLGQVIEMVETAAAWVRGDSPPKVVAVSLNTHGMSDEAAVEALEAAARESGLPAFDPIRTGCAAVVDRLLQLAGS